MSAAKFKVGDRVRCSPGPGGVGVVDQIAEGGWIAKAGWIKVSGADPLGTWSRWVDSHICTPCPPMSHEAKMVWHAMRAGAKRADRYEWTDSDRTTWRIHTYEKPVSFGLYLRVDIPRPVNAVAEVRP